MRNIISPQNNIIVQLQEKFYDTVTFDSGVTLYRDTTFHPEESATLVAKVVSSPRSIIHRVDYEGYTELPAAGDTVLIRYDVVFSYHDQPDRASAIHDNVFWVEGEEYWRVDIMQAFAIQEGNGWRMLNGYLWCDKLQEARSIGELLILPEHLRTEIRRDKMKVRYAGHLQPGTLVECAPNVAQAYQLGTDAFYIIHERHLLAASM